MDDISASKKPSVRVYPKGPILVRGDVSITDGSGGPIDVDRATIALRRYGKPASRHSLWLTRGWHVEHTRTE
jgi:hypothetical protein